MNKDKTIEKIALGDLQIRGHIDMQITNPLTGRPYYKFEDHNLVMDGLYKYLKALCIASLCTYNGATYGHRPMTAISGTPNVNPCTGLNPYHASAGFANYVHGTAETGSSSYPPSTSSGARLRSPIDMILLTNSAVEPSSTDALPDGDITALADMRTVAESGSKYGTFTYARSLECYSKVYRRWDWTTANGNGSISKIMLCQSAPFFMPVDFKASRASLNASSITGITSNGIDLRCVVGEYALFTESVNSVVMAYIYKLDKTTPSFIKLCSISFENLGLSAKVTSVYFSMLRISSTRLLLVTNGVSNTYRLHVYEIDTTSGELVSAREMYGASSESSDTPVQLAYNSSNHYYNPIAYQDENGDTIIITYSYVYKLPATGNKLTFVRAKISADSNLQNNLYYYAFCNTKRVTSPIEFGATIKFLNGGDYFELSTATGQYTTQKIENHIYMYSEQFYSYGIQIYTGLNNEPFAPNSPFEVAAISRKPTSPFIQVDTVPSPVAQQCMTARLLPEPIEKNDMAMYVGYTLEFL